MPVPLALAGSAAAAAGLAYINARGSISYDLALLRSVIPSSLQMYIREKRDRLNQFYVLESWAADKTAGNRPFLIFEGRSYTYAQTYDVALRTGHWLRQRFGVKPKDIVAIDFQNSETFVFLWFGLWSIGAKPAFINYNLMGDALLHCIHAATTSLVLADPNVIENFTESVRKQLEGVEIVTVDDAVLREISGTEPHRYPDSDRSEPGLEAMAILIYTSGTTGLPKPAIVSWAKNITSSAFVSRWLGRTPGDVFYTPMPLYHSTAALLGLLNTLESGTTIALGRKFSTTTFWKEVRECNATIIQYVGETCRYLLSAPTETDPATGENIERKHQVRMAFGNGLRPDVWARFKDRFGIETIAEFYAATEGTFGLWNMSRNDFSKGAIGRGGWLFRLILSSAVAIVKVDYETEEPYRNPKTGLCESVDINEPGEMLFKLPNDVKKRFQGYYNNPSATQKKILRNVFKKGDAYFRTGDVMMADSDGRTFFSDRIGDTFRWKSENVSTAEVSHVVGLHPSVQEANVYGVALPNHDGRAGCASISFDTTPPSSAPDAATLRDLARHVTDNLPSFARPIFICVAREIGAQSTGTNKQQKHKLRQDGVDPAKVGSGTVFWLRNGTYAPFGEKEWGQIISGIVRL